MCISDAYIVYICVLYAQCDFQKNRMIIGRYEETEYLRKKDSHPETSSRNIATDSAKNDRSIHRSSARHKFSILWKSFETYKYIINSLKAQSRDASCPHPYSCAHYILAVYM